VTGYCGDCGAAESTAYHTVTIDKTNGDLVWSTATDPTSSSDVANAITADDTNLYVTGYCTGCGSQGGDAYHTVAIDKGIGSIIDGSVSVAVRDTASTTDSVMVSAGTGTLVAQQNLTVGTDLISQGDVTLSGSNNIIGGDLTTGNVTTIAGTTTIAGSLTRQDGSISAPSALLQVGGDLTATSSFDNQSGTLILNGSTAQTVALAPITLALNDGFEDVVFPPAGWQTGGDSNWYRTSTTTSGGSLGAASSGVVPSAGGESWLQATTTLTAATTLIFDYRTSTEDFFDHLVVCVNDNVNCISPIEGGTNNFEASGLTEWTSGSVELGPGENVIRFAFVRDLGGSENDDQVWIDNVRLADGSVLLNDLTITNTAGTGSGDESVLFTTGLTTSGTFTMQASTSAAFAAGATSTFENVDWQGTDGSPVMLRSTTPGTEWYLDVPGSQINVEYVDVQDGDASAGPEIVAFNSTDSGNNTNWSFAVPTVVWDGGGADSNWETAANWDTDVVPGAEDHVIIDLAETVQLNGSTTIGSLEVGSSTVSVGSGLNFNYDAVGGSPLLVNVGDVVVHTGASVAHTGISTAGVESIDIEVVSGSLTVNGTITAYARGYRGGQASGENGAGPGGGLGASNYGPTGGAYGGHGGQGALNGSGGAGGSAYGSTTYPTQMGSGGGSGGGILTPDGGAGGGLIHLIVNGTTTVTGVVAANGVQGTLDTSNARTGASGSGGGIYISTAGIAGGGTIEAVGADAADNGLLSNSHGAGGGGRIALYYTNGSTDSLTIRSNGGTNIDNTSYRGAAGTIYIKDTNNAHGDLIIDNANMVVSGSPVTPIAADVTSLSVNDLIVRNQGRAVAPAELTVHGDYTNTATLDNTGNGTTTLAGTADQTVTGVSTFSNVALAGAGIKTISDTTVTDLTIESGVTLSAPSILTLTGDYTNNGTFTHNGGTVLFTGTATQIATGTMTGTSAFNNVTTSNTSGNGSTTFGVVFGDAVSASGTVTMQASTSVQFAAGSVNTLTNIDFQGAAGSPVWLRSSVPGTGWQLDVPGSQINVTYVDVQDSDATLTTGGVTAFDSTDGGNNTNWTFTSSEADEWNFTDWTLYDLITIDHDNIDESLNNFPVYVDLADLTTSFWSTVINGGGDIRVTTDEAAPQELAREVVSASTTLQTGELHFKANFINKDADVSFRIYYNGIDADYRTDQMYGAENVWTNSYDAVWHLEEDPSGGAGAIKDSTANGHDGTSSGLMTTSDSVAGEIGRAVDFDGSDDYIDFGTTLDLHDSFYLSTWIRAHTDTGAHDGSSLGNNIVIKGGGAGDPPYNKQFTMYDINGDGDTNPVVGWFSESGGTNDFADGGGDFIEFNQWYYVAAGFDGTDLSLYKDDAVVHGPSSMSNPTAESTNFRIADGSTLGDYFDGYIDEMRLSSVSRSAAWIKAEYTNQAATSDFYFLGVGVTSGSSTIANHTAGQVSNTFDFQNKTNEPLFAFRLVPNSGVATVTAVTIDLSGAQNISVANFSNLVVYENTGGTYTQDVYVGGATLTADGQSGMITLDEPFLITTATDYTVYGDVTMPPRGSQLNFDLYPSGVKIFDGNGGQSITGSVDTIQHNRASFRGGGGSAAAIGVGAPAGAGAVSGGTDNGGELIGDEEDFYWPTADSGAWTDPGNAYDQIDGTYADSSSGGQTADFTSHAFSVPATNDIAGIEVKLEVSADVPGGTIGVELSWDGGATFTSSGNVTPTLTTTDAVVVLGGPGDTWGRSWSPSELSDVNFVTQVTSNIAANTVQIDAIQVRVYHQSTGGGSGGGGAILGAATTATLAGEQSQGLAILDSLRELAAELEILQRWYKKQEISRF